MASKWTIQEDYIVCKYSHEHAWKNITVEQLNELMAILKIMVLYLGVKLRLINEFEIINAYSVVCRPHTQPVRSF